MTLRNHFRTSSLAVLTTLAALSAPMAGCDDTSSGAGTDAGVTDSGGGGGDLARATHTPAPTRRA